MSVDAILTLVGVDLTQPSPADVDVTFSKIADVNANLVQMSLVSGSTTVQIQFTTEDLQELGRKLVLILP